MSVYYQCGQSSAKGSTNAEGCSAGSVGAVLPLLLRAKSLRYAQERRAGVGVDEQEVAGCVKANEEVGTSPSLRDIETLLCFAVAEKASKLVSVAPWSCIEELEFANRGMPLPTVEDVGVQ